jgi:hypothetical protein
MTSMFVYWSSPLGDLERDDVEDALNEALGPDGEVVGGGSGRSGSNLDLEISANPQRALAAVKAALVELGMPADTYVVMDGRRHRLV